MGFLGGNMNIKFQTSYLKYNRKKLKSIIAGLFLLLVIVTYYWLSGATYEQAWADLKNCIISKIPLVAFSLLIFTIGYKLLNGKIADNVQQDIIDALKGNSHLINCLSDQSRFDLLGNILKTRLGSEDEDNERGALTNNILRYLLGEYNIRKNYQYRIMVYDDYPYAACATNYTKNLTEELRFMVGEIVSSHKNEGVWIKEMISYEKEFGNKQSLSLPLSIAFLSDSQEVFSDILTSHGASHKNEPSALEEPHFFREFFMVGQTAWEKLEQNQELRKVFVKYVMQLHLVINDVELDLDKAEYDIVDIGGKKNLVIRFGTDGFVAKLKQNKNINVSIDVTFPILFNRLFAAELCELSYHPVFSAQWRGVEVSAYPHWSEEKNDVYTMDNGIILSSDRKTKWFFPPCGLILAIHGKKH